MIALPEPNLAPSSKPAGRGNPTVGRFDSCAAPLGRKRTGDGRVLPDVHRFVGAGPRSPVPVPDNDGPRSVRAVDSGHERLRLMRPGEPPDRPVLSGVRPPAGRRGAPSREERRIVTVIFVDLVGFTSRAETLDPEDVRAILAPYHDRVRAEIESFGGVVEKFIGDAVVGVFGAPTAYGDDPERAVRAALSVRAALGTQVRIAVNTGEALVTVGARPEMGEAMVAGDVINTAARLQSAAPAGGVSRRRDVPLHKPGGRVRVRRSP